MSAANVTIESKSRFSRRSLVLGGLCVAVVAAIALDTTVVRIGSDADLRQQAFSPDSYGAQEFPRIREHVLTRAAEAGALVAQIASDKAGAIKAHGTEGGVGPIFAVRLQGTVGKGKGGIHDVAIEGVDGVRVRVQFGPAINGTDLRDVPGDIAFGQFKNQIEYQDAGAGINRAMKAAALDGIDGAALEGKPVSVTGVFRLINPKMWLVTPVEVQVQ